MHEPLAMTDVPVEDVLTPRHRRWLVRGTKAVAVFLVVYLLVAYLALPFLWRWRTRAARHPALDDMPRTARTHDGIPGDPINIALIGREADVTHALIAAGWHPATALGLRSDLRIAADTVLRRPDDDAPVSNLFLWGKKEDLAFEFPVGHDPRQRHHVRFWRSPSWDDQGRPLWLGGATFDVRVGLSHTTGQITHHISPDVDAERDKLLDDLQRAGTIAELTWVDDFQSKHDGRNGGGDPYHTDGRLPVAWLRPAP